MLARGESGFGRGGIGKHIFLAAQRDPDFGAIYFLDPLEGLLDPGCRGENFCCDGHAVYCSDQSVMVASESAVIARVTRSRTTSRDSPMCWCKSVRASGRL